LDLNPLVLPARREKTIEISALNYISSLFVTVIQFAPRGFRGPIWGIENAVSILEVLVNMNGFARNVIVASRRTPQPNLRENFRLAETVWVCLVSCSKQQSPTRQKSGEERVAAV